MKNREIETAEHFGLIAKVKSLEDTLLKVKGVKSVEFDLDGWWSNIRQVIVIPEYDIPVAAADYYEQRREMMAGILKACYEHDLWSSGDVIEDMGQHYYIVRKCGNDWPRFEQQNVQ